MNARIKYCLVLVMFFTAVSCTKLIEPPHEKNVSDFYVLQERDAFMDKTSDYFIVLGDIQEYTVNHVTISLYKETLDWIYSCQYYDNNIRSVIHTGDVTNNNSSAQWNYFYVNTLPIDNYLPFFSCTGNHDYNRNEASLIYDRFSSLLSNHYFPKSAEHIVDYFEPSRLDNIIVRVNIHDMDFNLLILEFGPRIEAVDWAENYVRTHPDDKFFLFTHEWLDSVGERVSQDSYAQQIVDTSFSTPEQVWHNLVYKYDNIVAVCCGHNGFSQIRYDRNAMGREVPQILFNLQYQLNGGDGLVELWEFPNQGDMVNVTVYDTKARKPFDSVLDKFTGNPISFEFKYR